MSRKNPDAIWAACLLCDAYELLESGRTAAARRLLVQAIANLPDIGGETRGRAITEFRRANSGMERAA